MGGFIDILYDNRRAGITDAMTINIALGDASRLSSRKAS